jgi:hypothetical protein
MASSERSAAEKAADAAYQARPEQVAKRVARNAARRKALREGRVHKGDGKDIDHIRMLDKGGTNNASNQRIVSARENRGWRKDNPSAYGKN